MDMPVNAEVLCADGACGRSSCVIIDQATQQVSYVVVEAQVFPRSERMVPVSLISESTSRTIKLRCTHAEFVDLPEFRQVDYQTGGETWQSYVPGEYLFTPGAPGAVGEVPLEHDNVPDGQLALRTGSRVIATDGEVGHVADLIVDPADNHLTHVIVQHGGIFRSRRSTIGADQIAHISDGTIYLKVDRHTVESFPENRP